MRSATSRDIRSQLDHPVVDGDGHVIEVTPVLLEYLEDLGGTGVVDRYLQAPIKRQFALDAKTPYWTKDSGAWVWPTRNTLDRATASLPRLYAERLDEFGIDFAIMYPSEGLFAPAIADEEVRQVACRAYNRYISDCYRPFADRMTPAAVIPMHTPEEAVSELRHAVTELGMKVVVLRSHVARPSTANAAERLDFLALGSDFDYDPVWDACRQLGVAATFHTSAIYGARAQIPNYVYNHIGVLAAGGEAICKALLIGGVTRRFPSVNFAFLEGGVGWAVNLYADLISHWERRNRERIGDFDPANLDRELYFDLLARYGDDQVLAHFAELRAIYGPAQVEVEAPDNFSAVPMTRAAEMLDLFVSPFWFGCEADDPVTAHAFDRGVNPYGASLKALLGSDNGHWDVPDMAQVLVEARELVECSKMTEDDFRHFVFVNPVELHAGMNPSFFEGTRIEHHVAKLLAASTSGERPGPAASSGPN